MTVPNGSPVEHVERDWLGDVLPYGEPCVNACGRENIAGRVVFVLTSNGPTCLCCLKSMLAVVA